MVPPLSPEHQALGRSIRELRTKLGLSQEELAIATGLHRNYVGGIERGERNPSFTNILKISAALGVRASALFDRAEKLDGDDTPAH